MNDIRVISPGIDEVFNETRDTIAEERCRRKYDLPEKYILHVGNIEPRKNLAVAVEAVRHLREMGMDWPLVLAGQVRRQPGSFLARLSEAQHCGEVRCLGYVDRCDLPSLYRLAGAFLCVSRHEGFGFPPLEAMACGTPVVSSMTGAMAQTLGDAAMAVNVDDAQAVANALLAVLFDESLRDRLRREGLRQAAGFRWDKSVAKLLDVYKEAATASRTIA
jgi:glycosyltransferase involved in cell wall biosynthesis